MFWKEMGYMGASGNRDSLFASKCALNAFTDYACNILAFSLFQNGTALMTKAYGRQQVYILYIYSIYTEIFSAAFKLGRHVFLRSGAKTQNRQYGQS